MRRIKETGALNVARWISKSRANGPGERFVLWLQGCGLGCEGCWNPDTWDFEPRHLLTVDEIMALVLETKGLEGVTLTGGEPFAQAVALVPLVRRIREAGLSLVVFTGHERDELRSPAARAVLEGVDILIAGRFVRAQREISLPLMGSRNQEVVFLTDRYSEQDLREVAALEIHLGAAGEIEIAGFPAEDWIDGAWR